MEVTLNNLHPNPFRNLPEYPIDPEKIKRLQQSIKRTGFWDNIVARTNAKGGVEIAYGHHRREALLRMYPKTHKVNVIVRKLDDGTMIKVMADENDEVYNLSPAVINETMKAARDFLLDHPKEMPARTGAGKRGMEAPVSKFLDWDMHRVEEALAELAAIEAGQLEKDAIEQMPSQKAAEAFRKQVKKHKAPLSVQRQAAVRFREGGFGTKDIPRVVIEAMLPKKKEAKLVNFEQFLEEGAAKITTAGTFLVRLEKYRRDFHGDIYRSSIERYQIESACERFFLAFQEIFTKRGRNGKSHRKSLPLPRK